MGFTSQVHPVNSQDMLPHKGFDLLQMAAEHQHSYSLTSEGEVQSSSSTYSRDSTPRSHTAPRQRSSPHPHRARTRSSPNPTLRQNVVRKVKDPIKDPQKKWKAHNDSIHPDKRFSTGNVLVHSTAQNMISRRA